MAADVNRGKTGFGLFSFHLDQRAAMTAKQGEFDLVTVTRTAVALEINLTEANEGTELYEMWAARVMQAQMHFERSEHKLCQTMIEEANRAAIPYRHEPRPTPQPLPPRR
jgi:hypothetical protein